MKQFFYRRIVQPVINLLKQGITPEKIALSIAFGVTLGVFPVLGSTTLLCFVAAWAFRLNLPAIQLVNYFVYPLQFALLLPFIRLGDFLFAVRKPIPFSAGQIVELIRSDMINAIVTLWSSTWHAMVGWCLVGPPVIWLIYKLLTPVLRRMAALYQAARTPSSEAAP